MRKFGWALLATVALTGAGISTNASAMTTLPAHGLNQAVDAVANVQDVHWRGWGWRRHWGHRWHHHHHHHWRRW